MSKLRMVMFAVVGILFSGMTVFAQGAAEAGDNASSVSKYRALAAGMASQSPCLVERLVSRALARRLVKAQLAIRAAGRIQTMMILGLALIESLVLFALLVIFAVVKPS